jgi:hypothetical protein
MEVLHIAVKIVQVSCVIGEYPSLNPVPARKIRERRCVEVLYESCVRGNVVLDIISNHQ